MMNLIKADMYRIWRGKGIYISFALLIFFVVLTVFVFRAAASGPAIAFMEYEPGMSEMEISTPFQSVAYVTGSQAAQMALYNVSSVLVYIFLGIIVVVAMGGFSSGAIKNDLAIGIPRGKIYLSKWMLASGLCLLLLGANLVLSVALVIPFDGLGDWGGGYVMEVAQAFLLQGLATVAVVGVGIFFAFLTKKTSATIGLFLAFMLVPAGLAQLLSIAFERALDYMVYDLGNQLVFFASPGSLTGGEIARGVGVVVGYMVVTALVGVALFKKAEVK